MELLGISEQLIEALPDAVFVVGKEGRIVFLNAQAEALFGFTRQELLGQPIERLVPREARAVHPGHRERYTRNAQARPMGAGLDLSGLRKDGSQFPAEISLSAIETAEGRLVTAVVRDATERKKTQAKFEGLLEAAPDAMLGVDTDGIIRLVNTQAERLFGYDREELLGKPIETLVPDRVRDHHPGLRYGYFTDPQVRPMGGGIDLSGRRKDGTEFPAEISLSSIDSEDGILATAAVRDVTERKAFEMVVAGARDTAERAARSRQEFLANMSHEIRTPMNAVIGMTSLLLDTDLDVDQRDYVETVRTSGDHLLTIINDILDYAKIDSGKMLLEELPFDLRSWLQETLDLISLQAHDKGLEIACDVAPDVPDVVVGDPSRLRQVLVNLLSNAVKFTEHGEVIVRMGVESRDETGLMLRAEVTDTGVGISPDRVEYLFDPFTQADSTTTRMYGGTGLGLAISRQLASSMGGAISMHSEVGVGTTVGFTFRSGISDAVTAKVPMGLAGKVVLIVDDNATNRVILSSWVERHDMHSISAASAEEALELLGEKGEFDFALVDLMMPGMDGAELGDLLKIRTPGAHLIMLSSAGPYARQVAGLGTFDAVLSKPANQKQLFDVMSTLLLPDRFNPREVEPRTSAFDLPGAPRQLSILVVEDTPVNQKVARHLLARFGFRADVAASGHEAIAALEQRHYDLVLMDVQMPEMDGLEATRVIRSRWPDRAVRIVAMTANVSPDDVRRCLASGMDDFLGKPIIVEELANMLGASLAAPPADVRPGDLVDPLVLGKLADQIGTETVQELVEMYFADLDVAIPRIVDAGQARDRDVVASTAHRLKSASRSLGARALGDLLHTIEMQAPEADWTELDGLMVALTDQVLGTREALQAVLTPAGT